MPLTGFIFICLGTVLMVFPFVIVGRRYGLALWKCLVLTPLLTIVGTAGTYLMYWVENGEFAGASLYGAVFLVPLVFVPLSFLFRIPCGQLLDLCAMGECVMLALMRVNCLISGCCGGCVLCTLSDIEIRFPNQIAEMLTVLTIFFLLIRWVEQKPHRRGTLYGWYLLLYGSIRFILTFLREEWAMWEYPARMPMAVVWSPTVVVLGAFWLFVAMHRQKKSDI